MTTTTRKTLPTIVEALAAVMGDVQGIRKGDKNTQQGYNFRGIDSVVNAVGPAFRTHGVVAVPISATCESEHYTTAKGTPMRGVTLTVGFRFYGPAGDFIDAMVCGEASDSGDKAIPKAHSVAYRTLLLQALCIPTDEVDPDAESHERATAPKAKPAAKPAAKFEAPAGVNGDDPERLAKVTAALLAAGAITQEQLDSAAASSKPGDLLGRLERFAEQKGVEVSA